MQHLVGQTDTEHIITLMKVSFITHERGGGPEPLMLSIKLPSLVLHTSIGRKKEGVPELPPKSLIVFTAICALSLFTSVGTKGQVPQEIPQT